MAAIDLRSDTLSKPTPAMLAAMAAAEVGDEQYLEDPSVNELQRRMAELLGHEASLFLPTATMANQVALRTQTRPGAMLLAEERTHVMVYEWGGPAIHSGLVMRSIAAPAGRVTPAQIYAEEDLGPGGIVVLENTHRSSGGRIWPLDEFRASVDAAHERGAKVHLDGARLFNASVGAGIAPAEWARHADSVQICFSKGLGCPLGAVVAGSAELHRARLGEQVPLRRRHAPGGRDRRRSALRARPPRRPPRRRPRPRAPARRGDRPRRRATSRRTSSSSRIPATASSGSSSTACSSAISGPATCARSRTSGSRTTTSIARSSSSRARSQPTVSTPDALAAELERLVRREQHDKRLPSITAAVLRDGETVWETAVGAADVKEQREATPDTQYRLGSITKTFTAAAIMQLRDEGKLDLEDTLDKHIDGVAHAPTLRRLLSHTSGMQRETHDDAWLHARFAARARAARDARPRRAGAARRARASTTRTSRSRSSASSSSASPASRTPRSCRSASSRRSASARTTFDPVAPAATGLSRAAVRRGRLGRGADPDRRVDRSRADVGDGRRPRALGRVHRRAGRVDPEEVDGRGDAHGADDRRPRPLDGRLRARPPAAPRRRAHPRRARRLDARLHRRRLRRAGRQGRRRAPHELEHRPPRPARAEARRGRRSSAGPCRPSRGRVDEPPPDDVRAAPRHLVHGGRPGRLPLARRASSRRSSPDAADWEEPAVFARESADRWRVVSGWEHGEALRIEQDRMVLAGYPVTRAPGVWV